ncbi:MAG: hypothetical protein ACK4FR_07490 [Tabrizicola sp.]
MVEKFERYAFVRLKANANCRAGKPDFDTVTIEFVPDAADRVAEVDTGNSHVTREVPHMICCQFGGKRLKLAWRGLKLRRTDAAQFRMPSALVAGAIKVVEHVGAPIVLCAIDLAFGPFDLKRRKEALHGRPRPGLSDQWRSHGSIPDVAGPATG